MAEPTNNSVPNDGKSNQGNLPANNGQPSGDNNGQQPQGNDGKTIPVESYNVVAEKYRKAKEELDKIKADKENDDKKKLEEQGKFKELAEAKEKELLNLKAQVSEGVKTRAIDTEARKMGAVDTEVVVKLLDLNKITVSEDGTVDSNVITQALEGLKKSKPYLFNATTTPMGSNGGAPDGGATQAKKFKRSQLKDAKFYRDNEKDIMEAMRTGNIIND